MNNEKPDQSVIIDRHGPEINVALEGRGEVYHKHAEVHARQATEREEVVTVLKSGAEETHNIAEPGSWIVTNPGGEQYVVPAGTFEKRYEQDPEESGVYQAKGAVVAVENPFDAPIAMRASWGEMQHGDESCVIADTYDTATGQRRGEPYIIDGEVFKDTYQHA